MLEPTTTTAGAAAGRVMETNERRAAIDQVDIRPVRHALRAAARLALDNTRDAMVTTV